MFLAGDGRDVFDTFLQSGSSSAIIRRFKTAEFFFIKTDLKMKTLVDHGENFVSNSDPSHFLALSLMIPLIFVLHYDTHSIIPMMILHFKINNYTRLFRNKFFTYDFCIYI